MTTTVMVLDDVQAGFPADDLVQTAKETLRNLQRSEAVVLTIRLVDDRTIRSLNRQYLGRDAPTDVLSFPVHSFRKGQPPADLPKGPILLGEVVVNLNQARRQASPSGQGFIGEVQSLVEHGVRHLIGFHHQDSKHG